MPGYIRLRDRDPDRHKDPKVKAKIIEAKLKHLLGVKPNFAQEMLIKTAVPLFIKMRAMQKEFVETGEMPKTFLPTYTELRITLTHLLGKGFLEGTTASQTDDSSENDTNLAGLF